jgi:hypothetical protein
MTQENKIKTWTTHQIYVAHELTHKLTDDKQFISKDEILKMIDEFIENVELAGHESDYDSGYFDCLNNIKEELKRSIE